MLFTYSGNPATSPLDALRFSIGDTVEGMALLSDGEIAYLLSTYGSAQAAILPALYAMLRICMHDTITGADGVTRDLRWRQEAIQLQLQEAEQQQALLALPAWGGTSRAERDARRTESDFLQPAFVVPEQDGEGEGW